MAGQTTDAFNIGELVLWHRHATAGVHILPVSGPTKTESAAQPIDAHVAGSFKQLLVNEKVQIALAAQDNETEESTAIDTWFNDVEQSLSELMGVRAVILDRTVPYAGVLRDKAREFDLDPDTL